MTTLWQSLRQKLAAHFVLRLWIPGAAYPAFKRLFSRWVYSATRHGHWMRVTLR